MRVSPRLPAGGLPLWAGLLAAGCEIVAGAGLVVLTVRGAEQLTATTSLGSLVLGAGLPLAALRVRHERVERWRRLGRHGERAPEPMSEAERAAVFSSALLVLCGLAALLLFRPAG